MEKQQLNMNSVQLYDLLKDNSILQRNKIQMLQIMKDAPITGIYMEENRQQWNTFFKFYTDFLNAQLGPRGQCAKKIRQDLKLNSEAIDEVLQPYKMSHRTHIRSIYVKFKHYMPCQQYQDSKSVKQNLQKYQQWLWRISQPLHPMYLSIKSGLLKKHGAQFPYQEQILRLKQNYQQKVESLTKTKHQVSIKLQAMKEYIDFVRMNNVMKKYFQRWVDADSAMGKDSCNRGSNFQFKVLHKLVPYIIYQQRQCSLKHLQEELFTQQNIHDIVMEANCNANKKCKTKRLQVFTNMKWTPRSLGEIDIAIVEYIPELERYQAILLIECKARLFDIREASYQVFPEYFQKDGKVQLSGKYGPVFLCKNITSYIVTSLPDFQYVLPIESELKATFDRLTKDKPIQEISENQIKQAIFESCIQKFENKLSPLDWFIKNDSKKIIVLSKQI